MSDISPPKQATQPAPALSPQMQMAVSLVIAYLAKLMADKGWATSAQFTQWANDTVDFVVGVGIPVGSLIWGLIAMRASRVTKFVASRPEVDHVAMSTNGEAAQLAVKNDAGQPIKDKIIGPTELLDQVANRSDVAAVVLHSEAAADAHPCEAVVGPSALKPAGA